MPVKEKKSKKNYMVRSSKNSVVNEPVGVYTKALPVARRSVDLVRQQSSYSKNDVILIGAALKPENQMTSLEKMKIVHLGLSKQDLESLKAKTRLDYGKLAKVLSVTRATLINKKKQQKFSAVLSERIMSLADIYSYGYEVFEDEDRFNRWMFRPNQALNGQAPYEFMDNHFGREEVRNIIGRIEYGVYS